MVGGAILAWVKANGGWLLKSVKLIPSAFRYLTVLSEARPGLKLSAATQPEGLPFRDDWLFVAVSLSNSHTYTANDLSITMHFKRGAAEFTPIRVPFVRPDTPAALSHHAVDVIRLKPGTNIWVPVAFYKRVRPGKNLYYLPHWPKPVEAFEAGKWACTIQVLANGRVTASQEYEGTISDYMLDFKATASRLKALAPASATVTASSRHRIGRP